MARLTDDAGETSENVPRPRFDFGNDHAYNGLQARSPLSKSTSNLPEFNNLYSKCPLTSKPPGPRLEEQWVMRSPTESLDF
ncbi:unnamed protein product [Protopolystoma xenopodis]|uniref:Uncharacterized protein n=1 Tax=Protopolystoma xenopodis TaxID=117903 RepID=A0A448WHQ1_9PLAT|nr:unnamed protein product [Protopolystoma xenopodis]